MARAKCITCGLEFPVIDAALHDADFDIICPQCGRSIGRDSVQVLPAASPNGTARDPAADSRQTPPAKRVPLPSCESPRQRDQVAPAGPPEDAAARLEPSGSAPDDVTRSDTADRPRSLWAVMRGARAATGPERAGGHSEPTHDMPRSDPAPVPISPAAPRITEAAPTTRDSSPPTADDPSQPDDDDSLMYYDDAAGKSDAAASPSVCTASGSATARAEPAGIDPGDSESGILSAAATSAAFGGEADDLPVPVPPIAGGPEQRVLQRLERLRRRAERRAAWALRFALAGVALCPLALTGAVWSPYPAGVIGIAAVSLGLSVLFGRGLQRMSQRSLGQAVVGLVLGLVAMFAGPLWLQRLGRERAASRHRQIAAARLERIGVALQAYVRAHGHFPAGGVFRDDGGNVVPMHGWMTALLPHMGYETLYARVDFDRPFDAPANRDVFRQVVPEFTVPEAAVLFTADGLAVTHFAGVGGERIVRERGVVGLGVFGVNSRVTPEDVRDGLSQTIVVGQVADALPAWGSAENWREIGAGLNQGHRGFGNPSRTGALFLFADGSVRFFSNRTPRELLIRLSTRDGEDGLPRDVGNDEER